MFCTCMQYYCSWRAFICRTRIRNQTAFGHKLRFDLIETTVSLLFNNCFQYITRCAFVLIDMWFFKKPNRSCIKRFGKWTVLTINVAFYAGDSWRVFYSQTYAFELNTQMREWLIKVFKNFLQYARWYFTRF